MMDNGFTVEDLGREFGVLIGQKVAQVIVLKKENETLRNEVSKLMKQLGEAHTRLEEFQRMTGRS